MMKSQLSEQPVLRSGGIVGTSLVGGNCSQGLLRPYGIGSHQRRPPPSVERPGDSEQMTTPPYV